MKIEHSLLILFAFLIGALLPIQSTLLNLLTDNSNYYDQQQRSNSASQQDAGRIPAPQNLANNSGGNEDGALTEQDSIWPYLQLWTDSNHDGVSEAGELTDVTSANVLTLELSFVESEHRDPFGNRFRYKSRATIGHNGTGRFHVTQTYDVFFVSAP